MLQVLTMLISLNQTKVIMPLDRDFINEPIVLLMLRDVRATDIYIATAGSGSGP